MNTYNEDISPNRRTHEYMYLITWWTNEYLTTWRTHEYMYMIAWWTNEYSPSQHLSRMEDAFEYMYLIVTHNYILHMLELLEAHTSWRHCG